MAATVVRNGDKEWDRLYNMWLKQGKPAVLADGPHIFRVVGDDTSPVFNDKGSGLDMYESHSMGGR